MQTTECERARNPNLILHWDIAITSSTADDELMVEFVYKVLATDGAQRSFDSCMQSFDFVLRLATST